MENKNMTGYPSIDKPWLKYYTKDKKHFDRSKSIYQHFYETALNNEEQIAYIEQNKGVKLTYKELLEQADRIDAVLSQRGICSGSRVGLLCFYSDFEPTVILAANKVGALVKMVSPDLNVKEMSHSISELDMLFVDGCFDMLENAIRAANIPVVWNTAALINENSRYSYYNDMFSKTEVAKTDSYDFKPDEPAIIIYSSGTTGIAKPIGFNPKFCVNTKTGAK